MKKDNYLICYDIVEDPVRNQISNVCKEYGLERIQYSVFYGRLNKTQKKEIQEKFKDIINKTNSNIHIIFICNSCTSKHNILSSIYIEESKAEEKQKKVVVDHVDEVEELHKEIGVLIL